MSSVSVRSYLAAGVAAAGIGAVALSPVHPVSPVALAPEHAAGLAVNLAAAVTPVGPVTAITNAIVGALDNFGTLATAWGTGLYVEGTIPTPPNLGTQPGGTGGPFSNANGNLGNRTGGYAFGSPLPILQQVVLNAVTYLGELPDIGAIAGQVIANIGNAFNAPFQAGEELDGSYRLPLSAIFDDVYNFNQNVNATPYIDVVGLTTLTQRDIGALLPTLAGPAYPTLKPIVDFATTPISGLIIGALGPVIGPVISVVNSISNTVALLEESEWLDALTEVINIPANAINAFLNGGPTLDLTGLIAALGVELPSTIQSIGLKMGGLLSPGGVAFDSIAATAALGDLTIPVAGHPIGPIGALLGLTNYVATAIKVTPPAPTASVRAAAADSAPEADAPAIEAPASTKQDSADPTVEVTSVSPDEPVAVVAERPQDDPAPAKQRQARRGAAATGNDNDSATKDSTASPAPAKAAASRRSAR